MVNVLPALRYSSTIRIHRKLLLIDNLVHTICHRMRTFYSLTIVIPIFSLHPDSGFSFSDLPIQSVLDIERVLIPWIRLAILT